MPASTPLTPEFLFDVESRMRVITLQEYQRLLGDLYYSKFTKELPSTGKRERLQWLIDTASIQYVNRLGGEVEFDDIVSQTTEFTAKAATNGLRLNRFQLEDHDGGGVDLAGQWSRTVGAYAAYWPQKQVLDAVRKGGDATSLAYDGEIFFSKAHPLNPFDSAAGTYSNYFAGTTGDTTFRKAPIDESVTVEAAVANLNRVVQAIREIPMPNGEDPRKLRASMLIVPPKLAARAAQLTNARFIAQAASSGGGAGDIQAIVSNWNLGQPVIGDELAAKFGGIDTTYYIAAEQITSDQLGAFTYVNREPFQVIYNSPMTSAELNRANELQWVIRGRNTVGYGHPFLFFRVDGT